MQKQPQSSENITVGSDIWVEVIKLENTTSFPFNMAKVKAMDKSGVKVIYDDSKEEYVKYERVTRITNPPDLNVNDMAKVNSINQVDLLNNILNRFKLNQIFTNVGKTLIVVNPYRQIPNAFTQETMGKIIEESDAKSIKGYDKNIKLEPHIYQISIETINNLLYHRKPQAIVISGESGAGKTETAKQAMRFITYYFSRDIQTSGESLEEKILSCNPILESFGNSKTVRNDNSSRFGKYIKILIDYEKKQIIGGNMVTYLLEKSRVCKVSKGERNFHIFYQIIKAFRYIIYNEFDYDKIFTDLGLKDKIQKNPAFGSLVIEGLNKNFILNHTGLLNSFFKSDNIIDCSNFSYLFNDIYDIEKVDDVKCFFETVESFLLTGFQEQEIIKIIEITCGILLLGNIEIQSNPIENDECILTDRGLFFLEKTANLFDMEPKILRQAILYKIIEVNKKFDFVSLELKDALTSRDTLAKELYSRLFSFMVRKMNLILDGRKTSLSGRSSITSMSICHIGLLDIFGFECFESNSLEQLCINYANEKLQQLYINDIFKETKRLFENEGLFEHFQAINYEDNQKIIDLIDSSPNGIFICLESKCKMKQIDDKGFAKNVMFQNKTSPCLVKSRLGEENFIIKHTAKDVDYNSKGYCEKNLDEFKLIMENSVSTIKDKFKAFVFAGKSTLSEQKPGINSKDKFLCGKFMKDMAKLKSELEKCVCQYIRCLKPNEVKKANFFVSNFVMQQIRYLGILDTIRIRREGFPIRLSHHQFFHRYEDVCYWEEKPDPKLLTWDDPKIRSYNEKIISLLCPSYATDLAILFGKTMMLLKQESYDRLDKLRGKIIAEIEKSVTLIAMRFRGRRSRKHFLILRKYTVLMKRRYFIKKCFINIKRIKKFINRLIRNKKFLILREKLFNCDKKLLKIKKLLRSYTIRFRLRKTSQKILKLKRAIEKFRYKIKFVKYQRLKNILKQIIDKSISIYYEIKTKNSAIMIQKHYRTLRFKKKEASIWEESKKKIQDLRFTLASTKIQKNYRGYKIRKFKNNCEFLARKIPAYFRRNKIIRYILKLREKVPVIQRVFRRYYGYQKILRIRTAEFNELENTLELENRMLSELTLFPNNALRAKSQRFSSIQKIEKEFLQKHYYERKLLSHQPEFYYNTTHLKVSHFNDPKLLFFAHVLDMDVMVNTDEMYHTPWSETFSEIQNFCIDKSYPLMGIELGEMHTSLITSNGKVFTWGFNSYGQCGFEIKKDTEFKYDLSKLNLKKDKKINKNDKNSEIKKTELLNRYLAKFESYMTEENEKTEFEVSFMNEKIRDNNYYKDENNIKEVFSHNSFGEFYYLKDPIVIDNYECREIKTGEDYSMLLSTDGRVFVCGKNSGLNLGLKNKKNIFSPQIINEIFSNEKSDKSVKISSMACGKKIKVFLNDIGDPFIFNFKKLGPEKIKIDIKFSHVECGYDFAVLLASNGLIYTYGNNSQGQLGHGDFLFRQHPTEIAYFKIGGIKGVQISCGYKHVIMKNSLNKVYTWGWNSDGQLGNKSYKASPSPVPLEFTLENTRVNILNVSAGFRSSCFLSESRRIIWCGSSGDISRQSTPVELMYKLKLPELFSYDNHHIIKLQHSWSKSMSIMYAIIAETRPLQTKLKNPQKMISILNSLSNKWNSKSIFPPKIDHIDKYIANKHKPKSSLKNNK